MVAGLTGAAVAVTALALTGVAVASGHRTPVGRELDPARVGHDRAQPGDGDARWPPARPPRSCEIYVAEGASKRAGSGVVLRADGALLTSATLVRGVQQAKVVLADGRQYDGTVAATDPDAGLAVVRIDADGLTPARALDTGARTRATRP